MDMFFSYWIWVILFALLFIAFVNSGDKKKNNIKSLSTPKRTEPNPNEIDPLVYLQFLRDANIDEIDLIYSETGGSHIKDRILWRAFLKKYRLDFDYDFFVNELNIRETNKKLGIKRKINRRAKEELYNDLFDSDIDTSQYQKIAGYRVVGLFDIAGIHIGNRFDYILNNASQDDTLLLSPEPNNAHDKNAIKIIHKRKGIGYVGRSETSIIKRALQYDYKCFLYSFDDIEGYKFATYLLYVQDKFQK